MPYQKGIQKGCITVSKLAIKVVYIAKSVMYTPRFLGKQQCTFVVDLNYFVHLYGIGEHYFMDEMLTEMLK